MVTLKLMKNDSEIRNRYLDQYSDIYGENVYLSSIDSVENKISTIKGGSELTAFYHLIKKCKNCLFSESKSGFNFGMGNANSKIVFITASKGAEEDGNSNFLSSESGQLFDKILSAINLSREDVYISNLLDYTLSTDNELDQLEYNICEPHFNQQLQIINPTLIVAMGEDVGNKLLKMNKSISELNKKVHDYEGIDLLVTYHPEAILKNPKLKQPTWEDFKNIRDNYLN